MQNLYSGLNAIGDRCALCVSVYYTVRVFIMQQIQHYFFAILRACTNNDDLRF
jgi:hypothetical protein